MQKLGFNLLRPQIAPEDRWDKIYNWVNTSARVIVIFVELIVIVCFGMRIYVDRVAKDLEQNLKDYKVRLDTFAQSEAEIRRLQAKTKTYDQVWGIANSFSQYIKEIYDYNPNLFSTLAINISDDGQIAVSGVATRVDIGDLETKMKNSSSFVDVQLASFKPDGDSDQNLGTFQIQARLRSFKRTP